MRNKQLPDLEYIIKAHQLIKPFIHKTPVLESELLNHFTGINLYFKCENFQKSGAFKFRGATHALLKLIEKERPGLVTTHSSGNHAGALSKASSILGVKCVVIMPETAPEVKVSAVKGYGSDIRFCKPTLEAREETTEQLIEETGAELIHPYDNYNIIAGQGTAALELIEMFPMLNLITAPVGGGGLLSGTAITAKSKDRNIIVYGAEPTGADDACRSFKSGKLIPSSNPDTIADGLLTSLSERTFKAISKYVDDIITVTDTEIIEAMKQIWQFLKIVVEPSAAVPFAAILKIREDLKGKHVGIILSGGNVDPNHLPFQNTLKK